MAVRAVLGLAVHLFRQGFSLLLIYRLNLSVQTNGLLLSLQVLLTSLVQGLAIRALLHRSQDAFVGPFSFQFLPTSLSVPGAPTTPSRPLDWRSPHHLHRPPHHLCCPNRGGAAAGSIRRHHVCVQSARSLYRRPRLVPIRLPRPCRNQQITSRSLKFHPSYRPAESYAAQLTAR
ncbi:hypothetical protein CLOM_g16035 [Closterium sp. NIES-68]|nr:hypothetical protein CLOM_g6518 [Closterium sp. NIES-68]GJP56992.1 hypothetical protein CLOM_g16035 [Closterium sp. NIES-68]